MYLGRSDMARCRVASVLRLERIFGPQDIAIGSSRDTRVISVEHVIAAAIVKECPLRGLSW